jgi:GGDEF domain-containing protein
MRQPSTDGAYNIGGSFKDTPIFQRIVRERSGAFTARSTISGMDRLVSFTQIGELPLFVAVSQAIDDVYAEWWRRAIAIGSVTLILAVTIILLAAMFRRAQRDLVAVAVTDELTGLANRRCFDQMLRLEWQRGARTNTPLALLMIDVDNFKAFNDQHGHWKADEVLREFGRLLKSRNQRPGDLAARYGGEEFAVILPDANTKSTLVVAERTTELRCGQGGWQRNGPQAIRVGNRPAGHCIAALGRDHRASACWRSSLDGTALTLRTPHWVAARWVRRMPGLISAWGAALIGRQQRTTSLTQVIAKGGRFFVTSDAVHKQGRASTPCRSSWH